MSESIVQKIDSHSIRLRPRTSEWHNGEYQPKSYKQRVLNYLDTINGGPYRGVQLVEKVWRFFGSVTGRPFCASAAELCSKGSLATLIPRVPGVINGYIQSIPSWRVIGPMPGSLRRKSCTIVYKTAELYSTIGFLVAPFMSLSEKTAEVAKKLIRSASIVTFIGELCKLEEAIEDRYKARSLADRAKILNQTPELQQILEETVTLETLNMLKSACSVGGFILGLGFVYAGTASFSSCMIIAAITSLAGTVLGMASDLYEGGMKYEKLKFFDERSVEWVSVDEEPQFSI